MDDSTRRGTRSASDAREKNTAALLDAAERLLVRVGHAGVTSRALAKEAGINNGLVHYYFGSMDEVFMQVIERLTTRLVDRQRVAFSGNAPLAEKWRAAWRDHESDIDSGLSKIRLELRAMAWNKPELQLQINALDAAMREVLEEGTRRTIGDCGLGEEIPSTGLVALLTTLGEGFDVERLSGIRQGHEELLHWMDGFLQTLEERRNRGMGPVRPAAAPAIARANGAPFETETVPEPRISHLA